MTAGRAPGKDQHAGLGSGATSELAVTGRKLWTQRPIPECSAQGRFSLWFPDPRRAETPQDAGLTAITQSPQMRGRPLLTGQLHGV